MHMYDTLYVTYYGTATHYYNGNRNRPYADIDGRNLTFVLGTPIKELLDEYENWFTTIKDFVSNDEVCVTLTPTQNQYNDQIEGEVGNSYVFELTKNQYDRESDEVSSELEQMMPDGYKLRIPVTLGPDNIISINTIYYSPLN